MGGKHLLKRGLVVALAVSGFLVSSQFAQAQFSIGDADNYAVLFEGGGHNNLDLSGPDTISGNLGVGAPAGSTPGAQLSGNLTLNSTVSLNFAGSPGGNYQNSATFSGPGAGSFSVYNNVTQVQTDLNNLNTLSSTLGAETGTPLSININNNGTATISANTGNIQGGNSVFTVSSWNFGGGSTLTIDGNGLGDSVVVNFPVAVINNPSFAGTIKLTGGLTPDEVLFNFTGGSALSGGPTLSISANGATEAGIFLDPNGPMSIDNSVLNGRFFGGDSHNDQVVSGASVLAPAPEPQTFALLALGLAGLAVKRLRQSR
jgi:hypothetical protein